jgi:hypothetical protein
MPPVQNRSMMVSTDSTSSKGMGAIALEIQQIPQGGGGATGQVLFVNLVVVVLLRLQGLVQGLVMAGLFM